MRALARPGEWTLGLLGVGNALARMTRVQTSSLARRCTDARAVRMHPMFPRGQRQCQGEWGAFSGRLRSRPSPRGSGSVARAHTMTMYQAVQAGQ
jgi:hypothetical protein